MDSDPVYAVASYKLTPTPPTHQQSMTRHWSAYLSTADGRSDPQASDIQVYIDQYTQVANQKIPDNKKRGNINTKQSKKKRKRTQKKKKKKKKLNLHKMKK